MATLTNGTRTEIPIRPESVRETPPVQGAGWLLFAGVMLLVLATLNIIWGIAAVGSSAFFVADASYILITDLAVWGWIAIGLGALEVLAALSIWRGGSFGRWFGIAVAAVGIVGALLSMPAYPLWSLAAGALAVLVIYGLAAYGGQDITT
jgi:hypothetical protein